MAFWHRRKAETRFLPAPELAHDPGYGVDVIGTTGALVIADAYACIRALVDAASSLPLHTFRRTPQGRIPIDGRGARLLETPSPGATTANFIADIMLNLAAVRQCLHCEAARRWRHRSVGGDSRRPRHRPPRGRRARL